MGQVLDHHNLVVCLLWLLHQKGQPNVMHHNAVQLPGGSIHQREGLKATISTALAYDSPSGLQLLPILGCLRY
jgi:hypothetical protein